MTSKFLIVASPRTGSTLIANNLGSICKGEIWIRERVKSVRWTYEQANLTPLQYFNVAAKIGAKVMTEELTKMSDVDGLFRGMNKAIFVRRKNLTEQAISLIMAEHFGFQRIVSEEKPITLDIDQLKWLSEKWVSLYRKWWDFASSRCETTSFWYEEINENPVKVFSETRQFLDVPVTNTKPSLAKLRSPDRYKRIIVNYDEIVNEMSSVYGTPFGAPGTIWDDEDRWNGITEWGEVKK